MKAWPIAAMCVSIVVLMAFPHAAMAQDELRVARVVRSVGTDAEVLVAVPRALSGRTLAPNAFTVTVDGNPVTATVTRAYGRGFDVALVIETSASATEEQFVATKAAAVDFVLRQPAETRIELVRSDPPEVTLGFTSDRSAVAAAIRSLARAPGDGLVAALEVAARSPGVSRPVTIVAAATAGETTVPATALRDERGELLRMGPSQLFAVGTVSVPLAQLASDSGGFGIKADVRQLVGAFDSVATDLAGRYGLTFPVPANATRIDIRVAAPEATASASVELPSGAGKTTGTAGTAPREADSGIGAARAGGESDDVPVLAIAIVVGLVLAAGVLGALLVHRSRRRPPRSSLPAPYAPPPSSLASPVLLPPPPPFSSPPLAVPAIDLRQPDTPLTGYSLTALCDDGDVAELRAAVAASGIVVTQAYTVDEAMRAVVTGRTQALYVDGAMSQARELVAAVRQRNDAGWSSCPTLVHDSHGVPDPALLAVADAFIAAPIDASRVVAALATRA